MIYRYECTCGYKHSQFLKVDKDSILLKCERCGKMISARQVRDKTVTFAENNEVVGILRHETE
jgi:predicted nucleic acid-binding Zn ribbon protein